MKNVLFIFLSTLPVMLLSQESAPQPASENQKLILTGMTALGVLLISLSIWNFMRNRRARK